MVCCYLAFFKEFSLRKNLLSQNNQKCKDLLTKFTDRFANYKVNMFPTV